MFLFYNAQYKHSTEFAALELTDRITIQMDHGNTPISIFLDLSKAFNTLDHRIILEKFKCYGITGTAQKWMESYITNRNQYVEIDNTNSNTLPIMTGVLPRVYFEYPSFHYIHKWHSKF